MLVCIFFPLAVNSHPSPLKKIMIIYGVPQGTVVGPLLFLFYAFYPQIVLSGGFFSQLYGSSRCFFQMQFRYLCLYPHKTFYKSTRISLSDTERLTYAFISRRRAFCKAILSGLPPKCYKSVAIDLELCCTGADRDHKERTYCTKSLHQLPVSFRIDFKVVLL